MANIINTELYLDPTQASFCARAAGVARQAYNHVLVEGTKIRRAGGTVAYAELVKEFDEWASQNAPYVADVPPVVRARAISDYYQDVTGYDLTLNPAPEFRIKGFHDFFCLYEDAPANVLYVDGNYIEVAGLGGAQTKPAGVDLTGVKIKEIMVCRGNRRWYAKIKTYVPETL
jgi:hypothetical protein